jgi:type III secretion protein V
MLPRTPHPRRYADLVLVAGVVVILATMVVTLPPAVIDGLVALSIMMGVVLLLMAVYVASPLEFSVFPSALLISTVFRLAVAVATTKLILLDAHAGRIIDAFGHLVAGGNLVVGLVAFLIITVVQFIVIAKGAERVAEVSARFTLDALPGKQLSIDSDLRSGLIDKDEARRRRRELEQESKLHGSLDGAMKFVKGDAIAGIVVIVVNLLGGLGVGVLMRDLTLAESMRVYSILTIGEGMVAQLPALLSAVAAGLLVTRATGDENERHLGDAFARQLGAKPRVLIVGGALSALLALVPGFPAGVFALVALVLLATGALLLPAVRARWQRVTRPAREAVLRRKDAAPAEMATALPAPQPPRALVLEMPRGTGSEAAGALLAQAEGVLDRINLELGLPLPRLHLHATRAGAGWRLLAFEVPVAEGDAQPSAAAIEHALRRHLALFFGTQEASAFLTRASLELPDVVKEVLRALPLQRVAEVLRRLVEEQVPIRNPRDILEALADAAQREKDVFALTEFARIALKRQISHRVAPDGRLRALLLAPELEELLRGAIRVQGGQQQLALDPARAREVAHGVAAAVRRHAPGALVTAVDVRRHLRKLVDSECFDTPVLSYHELVSTLRLEPLARVGLPEAPMLEAA